jgi:hypothetical protein
MMKFDIIQLDRLFLKFVYVVFLIGIWHNCDAQGSGSSSNYIKETERSPENQVFQFAQSGTCTAWADGSRTNATLYLWIPEQCKQLKGLVIMCTNVPEHMLAGHPAIRKACAANDLGIIWSTPTFMNFRKSVDKDNKALNMALEYKTAINFLQQMLDGLAAKSGYQEVSTVPWLPLGESGHLLMVDALLEQSPQRCIAGVYLKNNHLPPHNREVPVLTIFGSAQEWGQDKTDIRSTWNDIDKAYGYVIGQRKLYPSWPFSYAIDGTSGHFDCSEKITHFVADYIDEITKKRVSPSGALMSLTLEKGFVAELPVPGHENSPIKPFNRVDTSSLKSPWYLTMDMASTAQKIARINWHSATQLPLFLDDSGKIADHSFNGISRIKPTLSDTDGITFTVSGIMADTIPAGFLNVGQKLSKAPFKPSVEWVSGQFKPLGNGKFRIMLDRSWPNTANYVGLRQPGTDNVRAIFQPSGLTLTKNESGQPQKITFQPIPDVNAHVKRVALHASSDAGLKVEYYVESGPAIILGNELVLTRIPPKSKFPVAVTVAAWQWGRSALPKVKMAQIVKQTFFITSN